MYIYTNLYIGDISQPFIVGKPVTGEHFVGRDKEIEKLMVLLSGAAKGKANNVILLGARRTGKSSILLNFRDKISKDAGGVVPVIFDASGIPTKRWFAKTLVRRILLAYSRHTGDRSYREKVKEIIVGSVSKIQSNLSEFDVGVSEFASFHLKLREQNHTEDELLEDALQYAEKFGTDKGITFVVMIDEFQDVLKWGDEFLGLFRKIVQMQSRVAYVFSGSAPTIMREMVYDSKSPFYKQLVEIYAGPLAEDSVRSFVKSRLATVGITIDESSLEKIFLLSGGLPDYVQRLGLQMYLDCLTEDRNTVIKENVESIYSKLMVQLDPDFSNSFKIFSSMEREVLIALAGGKGRPSEIASAIRKPQSSMPQILGRLMNQDVIERYVGSYRIIDAVFSNWLAERYDDTTG